MLLNNLKLNIFQETMHPVVYSQQLITAVLVIHQMVTLPMVTVPDPAGRIHRDQNDLFT